MFSGMAVQLHTPAALSLIIPFTTVRSEDPLIHPKASEAHVPIASFVHTPAHWKVSK